MDIQKIINIEKIKKFTIENKLLVICFFLTFVFFLLYHYWTLGWDFASYVINARFLFNQGDYSEVLRAPLTSFLLIGAVFFGNLGEYLYIAFAVILFFFANFKLSSVLYDKYFNKFGVEKKNIIFLFFIMSLTPFVLEYGLLEGTELLGLAFFELFLFYFINNKNSGHFLGLAFLTRYNFLTYFPFMLINKNYKKIIVNLILFFAVLSPWLIFNYNKWGNFLMSIVESYNHNISARQDIMRSFDIMHLIFSINFLIPLLIMGFGYVCFNTIKKKESKIGIKLHILFIIIFILVLWDYNRTPLKIPRYLFNITLPAAYFSLIGLISIINRLKKYEKKLLIGIFIFWIILLFLTSYGLYNLRTWDDMYKEAGKDILDRNLEMCYVASPHWVPINYYTNNAYSLWKTPKEVIQNNGIVIIFPNEISADDTFTMETIKNLPILKKTDRYWILAKTNLTSETCSKRFAYSSPATEKPCLTIAEKFEKIKLKEPVEKLCLLFNKI